MSEHRVALAWSKGDAPFTYLTYPRNHAIRFKDGATVLPASAAAAYRGDAQRADPEDLLVASLSSCHMLSFLAIAAKKRLVVNSYQDDAVGYLEDEGGKLWIARVILRPSILFETPPPPQVVAALHESAHHACFIANSVKTVVTVEPR